MKEGWVTKSLGEVCDILDNRRKPITKPDRTPGENPYYGATGVQDFVKDYLFDEPLVLVGEDGAKWGRVRIRRLPSPESAG
jgi:type I restriction enzyme S subunit